MADITFGVDTDDSGGGTDGTIHNQAWKLAMQTAIRAGFTPIAFTPTDASGAGLSLTNGGSFYIQIGKFVYVSINVTYPSTANGSNAKIGSLPFTAGTMVAALAVGFNNAGGAGVQAFVRNATTTAELYLAGAARTNANMTTGNLIMSGGYWTA